MWKIGHPGAGKTILAATVIEELTAQYSSNSGPAVYFFFFEHQLPNNRRSSDGFRSIMAQCLWRNRKGPLESQLLDRVTFFAEHSGHGQGQLVAADGILLELMRLCLAEDDILVFDGIDECDDNEDFVEALLKISESLPKLRIMLFSRINVPSLKLSVQKTMVFTMPRSLIVQDISRFCLSELEDMFDRGILPPLARDKKEAYADRLCTGADGMFLWARLMVKCMRSPFLSRDTRLKMIEEVNMPEGLEKMYERIIALICAAGAMPMHLASNVLTWLAFAVVPISTRQLRQAILAGGSLQASSLAEDVNEFQDCVTMACGGLVEPYRVDQNLEHPGTEWALRFIHASVQELMRGREPPSNVQRVPGTNSSGGFYTGLLLKVGPVPEVERRVFLDLPVPETISRPLSPGQSTAAKPVILHQLVEDSPNAQLLLATRCLQQLLYHTPAQPLAGSFNKRASERCIDENHPFTLYAAVHWLGYLESANRSTRSNLSASPTAVRLFILTLSIFLANPKVLSAWLEAFYTATYQRRCVHYHHPPVQILQQWIEMAQQATLADTSPSIQEVSETVNAFNTDLERILNVWARRLENSPELVWDEMTYFAPSRFFFAPGSLKVSIQDPEPPKYPRIAPDAVAQMSRTSSDGVVKATLSIWAPRYVEQQDCSSLCASS